MEAGKTFREFGAERQRAIFLSGEQGQLAIPIAPEAVEALARQVMTPEGYDYMAGGCGAEETLRLNRTAFSRWQIVPRILRDVSRRSLGIRLLGMDLPAPLLLAPVAAQELAHPEAEVASARAAAGLGLPFILSCVASRSIEDVAAVMGDAPRWFQLYWSTNSELTEEPDPACRAVPDTRRLSLPWMPSCWAGASATCRTASCHPGRDWATPIITAIRSSAPPWRFHPSRTLRLRGSTLTACLPTTP